MANLAPTYGQGWGGTKETNDDVVNKMPENQPGVNIPVGGGGTYTSPTTGKLISREQAMKEGVIDKPGDFERKVAASGVSIKELQGAGYDTRQLEQEQAKAAMIERIKSGEVQASPEIKRQIETAERIKSMLESNTAQFTQESADRGSEIVYATYGQYPDIKATLPPGTPEQIKTESAFFGKYGSYEEAQKTQAGREALTQLEKQGLISYKQDTSFLTGDFLPKINQPTFPAYQRGRGPVPETRLIGEKEYQEQLKKQQEYEATPLGRIERGYSDMLARVDQSFAGPKPSNPFALRNVAEDIWNLSASFESFRKSSAFEPIVSAYKKGYTIHEAGLSPVELQKTRFARGIFEGIIEKPTTAAASFGIGGLFAGATRVASIIPGATMPLLGKLPVLGRFITPLNIVSTAIVYPYGVDVAKRISEAQDKSYTAGVITGTELIPMISGAGAVGRFKMPTYEESWRIKSVRELNLFEPPQKVIDLGKTLFGEVTIRQESYKAAKDIIETPIPPIGYRAMFGSPPGVKMTEPVGFGKLMDVLPSFRDIFGSTIKPPRAKETLIDGWKNIITTDIIEPNMKPAKPKGVIAEDTSIEIAMTVSAEPQTIGARELIYGRVEPMFDEIPIPKFNPKRIEVPSLEQLLGIEARPKLYQKRYGKATPTTPETPVGPSEYFGSITRQRFIQEGDILESSKLFGGSAAKSMGKVRMKPPTVRTEPKIRTILNELTKVPKEGQNLRFTSSESAIGRTEIKPKEYAGLRRFKPKSEYQEGNVFVDETVYLRTPEGVKTPAGPKSSSRRDVMSRIRSNILSISKTIPIGSVAVKDLFTVGTIAGTKAGVKSDIRVDSMFTTKTYTGIKTGILSIPKVDIQVLTIPSVYSGVKTGVGVATATDVDVGEHPKEPRRRPPRERPKEKPPREPPKIVLFPVFPEFPLTKFDVGKRKKAAKGKRKTVLTPFSSLEDFFR